MLRPTDPMKPTNPVSMHEGQKRLKWAWQAQWRALGKEERMEVSLYVGNPGTLLNAPMKQEAVEKVQMHGVSPSMVKDTSPLIDDLCTRLESLTLNEREGVINHLCIAQGEPYSQLVWSTWRKKSDTEGIYLSIWKSMQLHVFIHLTHRWDEAVVLLDSGATENFIQELYAQQLKLPVKCLLHTRPIYNVNGTLNKNGHIHSYTDLEMQTGQQRTKLCFFLTNIGNQKLILGYPWFTATQPNIDWAWGWIEADQLPLIICIPEKKKVCIGECSTTTTGRRTVKCPYVPANGSLYVAWMQIAGEGSSMLKKQTLASN